MKILLIEDDVDIAAALGEFLRARSVEVSHRESLRTGVDFFKTCPTQDLVLLDWMLPDGDGVDIIPVLKKISPTIPIILLTARDQLGDKIIGFESGADDYITKPYSPLELWARIRARVRTRDFPAKTFFHDASFELDSRRVLRNEKEVKLSKMEFELAVLFIRNPEHVFSRDELLNKIWGYERFPTTRTVDTHILQIRKKLGWDGLLETVHGVGYRLKKA